MPAVQMPAVFPDAVVNSLLETFKIFVISNAELIAGAQDYAKALCDDLEVLRSVLGILRNHMEQKVGGDVFLANLSNYLHRPICRAEDYIESFIVTVSQQKFQRAVTGEIHAIDHVMELHNIGKEVDALKREVHRIYKEQTENGLMGMRRVHKDEKGNFFKRPVDDDMIGFKKAMDDILRLLKEGPDDLQTVSIVGILGLGKSTLAKQIFNHQDIESVFFVRAFIEVSQDFKRKEVLFQLVRALNISPEDIYRMGESDLEEAIRNYLEKRNYLIVLDDVWAKDAWNQLKACFPNNQKHSRILITTRHKDVAEHAREGQGVPPYMLRFLNDSESRQLLRKRVFGKMDTIKNDLEVHETAILDRCDGLPLAIVAVAGILTNHRDESYWWEDVSKKVETYNLAKVPDHAIKLSFNCLPYHLKPCFLYLGVFREDFEIPSRTLYQLWVSEGFVPPGDAEETSEAKAESFLEQLVDRSLVMVEKRRLNGRIKTIRIHDILREFCKTQAIEEDLFREIKFGEETGKSSADDDRRLCINSKVREYITTANRRTGRYVRSFLSFSEEHYILPPEFISEIPKSFKLLRVLDVRSIMFIRFPAELFYTFLLKYIAMSSNLKIIPEKVSNLRYLQTLIFNTTQRSIEIRADIWKMKQLRHLETNTSAILQKTEEPVSVNANLQTLSAISPQSCTAEVFERAQQLKKFVICGELAHFISTLFQSLSKLEFLENLKLLNVNTTAPLKSLPSGDKFPCRITKLTLQNTMLGWEWMSTLAKLKRLEVLKLKENAFMGAHWDTESTGVFSSLKVLHIGSTDLITWKASKGHFPQLTHLYFKHCTKLWDIPSDLVNVSTLELIDIYFCNRELVNSARKFVFASLQVRAHNTNVDMSTRLNLVIFPPNL